MLERGDLPLAGAPHLRVADYRSTAEPLSNADGARLPARPAFAARPSRWTTTVGPPP